MREWWRDNGGAVVLWILVGAVMLAMVVSVVVSVNRSTREANDCVAGGYVQPIELGGNTYCISVETDGNALRSESLQSVRARLEGD